MEKMCYGGHEGRVLGLEQSGVHDRMGWRKRIMGKLPDPCKHGNNRH